MYNPSTEQYPHVIVKDSYRFIVCKIPSNSFSIDDIQNVCNAFCILNPRSKVIVQENNQVYIENSNTTIVYFSLLIIIIILLPVLVLVLNHYVIFN